MSEKYLEFFHQVKEEHEQYDSAHLNDRVLVVDALNTFIRCFAAVPTMNEEGEHIGGITGFLKSVGLAIRTFKPTRCILVFDGTGGSQRRRKIFPDYKANRKHSVRLNRTYDFKDMADEDKARHWQLITLAQLLAYLPVTVLVPSNVEADDVIAYSADLVAERGGKAIIVSTDKDFLQLVSPSIDLWNPIKKKTYTPESVLEEYGIHPKNFAIFRAMDGDKSDNIPGIKGVGAKSLRKQYPQLADSVVVGIDEVLDYASRQQKGKIFETISQSRDIIERNYTLMRLDEVQMSGTTKLAVLDRIDSAEIEMDKTGLTKQLVEFGMLSSFGNYDQWVVTTWNPLTRFSQSE